MKTELSIMKVSTSTSSSLRTMMAMLVYQRRGANVDVSTAAGTVHSSRQ